MKTLKTNANDICMLYTIQSGEPSEDNLWDTVATYTWCTSCFGQVAALAKAQGGQIVCMICEMEDDDELGNCLDAYYIERC